MLNIILVGVGGAVGSGLRYIFSGLAQRYFSESTFPVGTLFVNVVGCAAIGVLSEVAEARGALSSEARTFLFIGLLGGFTTFSTFANESSNLLRDGQGYQALLNVLANVVIGFAALWLGRLAAHAIWR